MRHLRLLPWADAEGRPCYLSEGDSTPGTLSQLADQMELLQIEDAKAVLMLAKDLLRKEPEGPEFRFLTRRLAECLTDAVRICESRGRRLPHGPDEDDEGLDDCGFRIPPGPSR